MKVSVLYNFQKHLHIKMVCILKIKNNSIICLFFINKDFTISPSIWLGTSTGSVIVVNLNLIYEPRNICGRFNKINFIRNNLLSYFKLYQVEHYSD